MRAKHCTWIGLVLTALAGLAPTGSAKSSEDASTRQGLHFLRVGAYYINSSRVLYAVQMGDELIVVFDDAKNTRLNVQGKDAALLRSWLEGRPTPTTGSVDAVPQQKQLQQGPGGPGPAAGSDVRIRP